MVSREARQELKIKKKLTKEYIEALNPKSGKENGFVTKINNLQYHNCYRQVYFIFEN